MAFLNLTNQQWTEIGISAAILAAALILARPVLSFLLDRIIKRLTGRTKTKIDDVILDALRPPLFWLILVIAFQVALERLDSLLKEINMADVFFVLYFLLVFIAIWRLTVSLSNWYLAEIAPSTESQLDNQLLPFIRRVALIILGVIAVIILLGHFNVEVSGLVTTLGIGSLAVALAAQAALSDSISGFMIMLDRPFRIGDRIEILELGTWGDVIDIGLRSTHIRTRDNRMVIVPNSVISKSLVVNYSYPDTEYRIEIEIGVAYGTDIEQARNILIDAVAKVEGVLTDKRIEALFLRFGDSALIFRVRWWLDSYYDARRMFDKVNTAMYNALNEAGIEIPFPQQDVYHKINPPQIEQFKKVLDQS